MKPREHSGSDRASSVGGVSPGAALILGMLLLLAACGKGEDAPGPSTPPGGSAGKGQVESNGGNFTIRYQTTPDPIPTNQQFDLKFTVTPKGTPPGSPQTLKVDVDARMPAHFHGMNRLPKLTQAPDGSYVAEGMLFHMPGHWELYFDIARGGVTERAQVDVHLK